MSGPPTNIPAAELFARLMETPRPSVVVDVPRNGPDGEPLGRIRIWVLTQEEHQISTAAAEKFVRLHIKDGERGQIGYEDMFTNEMAVQILYRACRDEAEPKKGVFRTPEEIRKGFTTDEVGVLFRNYLTVELEVGPRVTQMSTEEREAWVSRIAEAGSAFPFDSVTSDLQKVLVLFMARQLRSFSTVTTSVSEPPESGSESPGADAPDAGPDVSDEPPSDS